MRRVSKIYLIPTSYSSDDIGNDLEVEGTPKLLMAEKKSVRQSEFYQAGTNDLKPELVFSVWPHEYKGEKLLKYNGIKYSIIRTFEKNFREIELVCEVRIGGN